MITEEKLSTQKEIQDRLEAHNVFVTQTTLSRDLREIGLTKVKKNDMVYYVLANETEKIDLVEFLLIIRRCCKSRVYLGTSYQIRRSLCFGKYCRCKRSSMSLATCWSRQMTNKVLAPATVPKIHSSLFCIYNILPKTEASPNLV